MWMIVHISFHMRQYLVDVILHTSIQKVNFGDTWIPEIQGLASVKTRRLILA